MKIGFIGAGKMGFTLGKHFTEGAKKGLIMDSVTGYYSKNPLSAKEAAGFTDTKYYDNLTELVLDSDTIFITVPDGQIAVIADLLDRLDVNLEGKKLIHASGACTSHIFSGMHKPIYGFSIHPIYAVNSKTSSYINFKDSFVTIEYDYDFGHEKHPVLSKEIYEQHEKELISLFKSLGHMVKKIEEKDKPKYHAAAVFSSNLVIGLYCMGTKLLCDCGFDEKEAEEALMPLFYNNAINMKTYGIHKALTGPVARNDIETICNHLKCFSKEEENVYKELSKKLVNIAIDNAWEKQKSDKDKCIIKKEYDKLNDILGGNYS